VRPSTSNLSKRLGGFAISSHAGMTRAAKKKQNNPNVLVEFLKAPGGN